MPDNKTIKSKNQVNFELKIKDLEEKLAQTREDWKRSLADYANLEKRVESQRQLYAAMASVSLVSKIIEVLDDFSLAQAHLKDPGLQMALDKLLSVLKSEGLEEINCDNKIFDPSTMECTQAVAGDKDKVINTKKNGYLLNGQCLRPAQVTVGQGEQPATQPNK